MHPKIETQALRSVISPVPMLAPNGGKRLPTSTGSQEVETYPTADTLPTNGEKGKVCSNSSGAQNVGDASHPEEHLVVSLADTRICLAASTQFQKCSEHSVMVGKRFLGDYGNGRASQAALMEAKKGEPLSFER